MAPCVLNHWKYDSCNRTSVVVTVSWRTDSLITCVGTLPPRSILAYPFRRNILTVSLRLNPEGLIKQNVFSKDVKFTVIQNTSLGIKVNVLYYCFGGMSSIPTEGDRGLLRLSSQGCFSCQDLLSKISGRSTYYVDNKYTVI